MNLFGRTIFETGGSVVVECRRCGKTLDTGATVCSVCDSTEIATYEFD